MDPVWAHAADVFGDPERAREWMESFHPLLGTSPAAYMTSDSRRAEVDRILSSIEHGLPV
jgi:uncharacterized protein (DUF2384 family)